jgi:formylglycine-generating enzyme required for sulfatase activity
VRIWKVVLGKLLGTGRRCRPIRTGRKLPSLPYLAWGLCPVVLAALLAAHGLGAGGAESKPAADDAVTPSKQVSVDLGKGIKLEMVRVPAGEFMMGSPDTETLIVPDEKPQHRVRITKPFCLGKYPVTQEQWEAVMGANPSEFKGPTNPVESVSLDDCRNFLKRLNVKVGGERFQLPTEAQWEYACRAGSKTRYCFGDDESKLDEYAWYRTNEPGHTHPVGKKKPNAWGLYDMHGNVSEVCADWYDEAYYAKSPENDPTGPAAGDFAVIRGASWLSLGSWCRSPARSCFNVVRDPRIGLRVSRVAGGE